MEVVLPGFPVVLMAALPNVFELKRAIRTLPAPIIAPTVGDVKHRYQDNRLSDSTWLYVLMAALSHFRPINGRRTLLSFVTPWVGGQFKFCNSFHK